MTTETASIRARLEEEQRRLVEEIEALLRSESDPVPERPGDQLGEGASRTSEHEKSLALVHNLRGLSAAVQRALEKLEKGTYGICDDCGQPIAAERLAAIPYATLCISCKSRRERR